MQGPAVLSAPVSEAVRYESDGVAIRAVCVRPPKILASLPVLLVLHEWWGLNEHITGVAQRCAKEGYLALAPNLYSRQGYKVTRDPAEAAALMSELSSQAILRDLNAAVRYLKSFDVVDPLRIGIIGFSMGGSLALTMATHNSDLKAAAIFYGKIPLLESIDALLCPLVYHYPGEDGWVTKQEVALLQQGLDKYGKTSTIYTYPEAHHSFCNEMRPEVYRAQDAELSWQRTLAFFGQHLW